VRLEGPAEASPMPIKRAYITPSIASGHVCQYSGRRMMRSRLLASRSAVGLEGPAEASHMLIKGAYITPSIASGHVCQYSGRRMMRSRLLASRLAVGLAARGPARGVAHADQASVHHAVHRVWPCMSVIRPADG
jgi:hypothetical protein